MSSFSSIACYSALSACSKEDIISAYARMLSALILKKGYQECKAEQMVVDFEKVYGFKIPYHPMRAIMDRCVQMGYLSYSKTTRAFLPNFSKIDNDNFDDIITQKDNQYKCLLENFNNFLIEHHNIHSSQEDLNDKICAFIERYGIRANSDREILQKVKDDFFFAEFLVHCEENGNTEVLDYLNEYTVGVALSEIFTYCESPEKFTTSHAHVYLDTGLLFKLFGIDSSDHSKSYIQCIKNMQSIGIQVMVYYHTFVEMTGIIENSKQWIGNPNFDATLSSETAYYFVTHNWSVKEVDDFLSVLRYKLEHEFNIKIDDSSYPDNSEIQAPYEADIQAIIEERYKKQDPGIDIASKSLTISYDAKSIFLTKHKNENQVAYHIDDVKNIFITTNHTLAKIGYEISYSIASNKELFIPIVMNDIKWGTLIWFNSPTLISKINRPRLVSAAYAAFRPNSGLIKRLNIKLAEMEQNGTVTPEQCYLLKVNPIAQHLLANKTMNDPSRFIDSTPLEILHELGQEAFKRGSDSRQLEVESLKTQTSMYKHSLNIEKQRNTVTNLITQRDSYEEKENNLRDKKSQITSELEELKNVKATIDNIVKRHINIFKVACTLFCFAVCVVGIYIGWKYSWVLGIIAFVAPILFGIFHFWVGKNTIFPRICKHIEQRVRDKQNRIRRFSEDNLQRLESESEDIDSRISAIESQYSKTQILLSKEEDTLNQMLENTPVLL